MKAPAFFSALAVISFGSSAALATPVGDAGTKSPWTLKMQAHNKKPQPVDVCLTAWIDRGQDVQVSISTVENHL